MIIFDKTKDGQRDKEKKRKPDLLGGEGLPDITGSQIVRTKEKKRGKKRENSTWKGKDDLLRLEPLQSNSHEARFARSSAELTGRDEEDRPKYLYLTVATTKEIQSMPRLE